MYTQDDLRSKSGRRQIEAAAVLGRPGKNDIVPYLARMFLGETWTEVSETSEGVFTGLLDESAKALARIGTDKSVELLLKAITEKTPYAQTRISAIYALEHCDGHLALAPLFEAANLNDKTLKSLAIRMLEQRRKNPEQFQSDVLKLIHSPSFIIALAGVSAAGTLRLRESIPMLRRFFEEPLANAPGDTWLSYEGQFDRLRALAARGLGLAGDCDYLREAESMPDSTSVTEKEIPACPACLVFKSSPPRETFWDKARSMLFSSGHQEDQPDTGRRLVRLSLTRGSAAVMGLYAAGEKNGLSALHEMLKHGSAGSGKAAVQILGDLAPKDSEALLYLKMMKESPDCRQAVRDAAIVTLKNLESADEPPVPSDSSFPASVSVDLHSRAHTDFKTGSDSDSDETIEDSPLSSIPGLNGRPWLVKRVKGIICEEIAEGEPGYFILLENAGKDYRKLAGVLVHVIGVPLVEAMPMLKKQHGRFFFEHLTHEACQNLSKALDLTGERHVCLPMKRKLCPEGHSCNWLICRDEGLTFDSQHGDYVLPWSDLIAAVAGQVPCHSTETTSTRYNAGAKSIIETSRVTTLRHTFDLYTTAIRLRLDTQHTSFGHLGELMTTHGKDNLRLTIEQIRQRCPEIACAGDLDRKFASAEEFESFGLGEIQWQEAHRQERH